MTDTTIQSVCYGQPGRGNTGRTLEIARQRADELSIRTVLVASTRGETGAQAAREFAGYDVVVVTGEGMKVCVEVALMAADAGLAPVGEPCIAIAGTGRGADTAVVLIPANVQQFFDLRVMEVLAKPRLG